MIEEKIEKQAEEYTVEKLRGQEHQVFKEGIASYIAWKTAEVKQAFQDGAKWGYDRALRELYERIEKENAELKVEIKQIIKREKVVPEHYLVEMIDKNKELNKKLKEDVENLSNINIKAQNIIVELKAQIEKIKTCSRCMSNNKDLEEYPCKDCFRNGVYTKWH